MEKRTAVGSGSEVDGGYLITPEMGGIITGQVYETSPMRQIASVITTSTDTVEFVNDYDTATAAWTDGESAVSDSNSPQIGKIVISVNDLVAQPKATQKLIDDSAVNIEQWLTDKLVDVFSRTENTAFVTGNGNLKPKGILSYDKTANGTYVADKTQFIVSGSAAAITADSILKLTHSLKDTYYANAKFFMNRATLQSVRLLKDSQNRYLWQPDYSKGNPDTLAGYEIVLATDMPVEASNAFPIAFGDFKRGYQIVDRLGIRIMRDPYTEKPFVKFYTTKRVGGGVVNFEAFKLVKCST
jgi:HK97 family phage major capsid protein